MLNIRTSVKDADVRHHFLNELGCSCHLALFLVCACVFVLLFRACCDFLEQRNRPLTGQT